MGYLWLDFYAEAGATIGQNKDFVYTGSCYDVLDSSDVVMDQIDRFDASNIRISDAHAGSIYALPAKTRVDVNDSDDGLLFRGVIVNPTHDIKTDNSGEMTLQVRSLTEECTWITTGMGYIDANELGVITSNLGGVTLMGESKFDYTKLDPQGIPGYDSAGRAIRLTTLGASNGWSASFTDNGVYQPTLAPVNWAQGYTQNANLNGNTISKTPNGTAGGWDAGGFGSPQVWDLGHDCAYSFQVVAPQQVMQSGLTASAAFGQFSIDFGFSINNGTWTILENGAPPTPFGTGNGPTTGTLYPNTFFTVGYSAATGKITYYITPTAGPLNAAGTATTLAPATTFVTAKAPGAPLTPQAVLATPNAEVTNAIFARTTTNSHLWWKVRYDDATKTGALIQLARDTYTHVRQAWDANRNPVRAFELGAMGLDSGLRLIDGLGGNARAMTASATNRVIRTIQQTGPDVTNLVNVSTPLGGGTGATQVTIELLWRILNDAKYENFGRYKGGYNEHLGNVFPEYDPAYTIHAVANDLGDYQYYMRSEASVALYGEMQGGGPDSSVSIADPNPTTATKELTQRALYTAWVGKFKRNDTPRLTLKITTEGRGKPCRAGDTLHVEYHGLGIVNGTPFVRMDVDTDLTVLSYKRRYNQGDREDTWELSNDGAYRPTDSSQAASTARQLGAVQITQNTNQSVSILSPSWREIRANGINDIGGSGGADGFSVVYPIKLLPTVYGVNAAYIRCDFMPFRQTMTLVDGGLHVHTVLMDDHDHAPPTALATDVANIGGLPLHFHQIPIFGGGQGSNAYNPTQNTDGGNNTSKWTFVTSSQNVFHLTANNSGAGILETNNQMNRASAPVAIDLTPSSHPHTVTGVDDGSGTKKITTKTNFKAFSTDLAKKGGTVTTDLAGLHGHVTNPDVNDTFIPAEIQVWIDSGTGVYVNRTSQLIDGLTNAQGGTVTAATAGGFTSSFEVEISRFMNAPGKTIRIKFISIASAGNPKGLGCLCISGTLAIEYGGLGSIVSLTQ